MADAPKPASAQDVIDTLKSINAGIQLLVEHFGCLSPRNIQSSSRQAYDVPQIATDRDLDSKYGDPEVRYDPRDWTGDSFVGTPLSQCSPAYLDAFAESCDSYADWADETGKLTSGGKPAGPYRRKDASRARGWAKRLRGGWKPPVEEESAFPSDQVNPEPPVDDDIPF